MPPPMFYAVGLILGALWGYRCGYKDGQKLPAAEQQQD